MLKHLLLREAAVPTVVNVQHGRHPTRRSPCRPRGQSDDHVHSVPIYSRPLEQGAHLSRLQRREKIRTAFRTPFQPKCQVLSLGIIYGWTRVQWSKRWFPGLSGTSYTIFFSGSSPVPAVDAPGFPPGIPWMASCTSCGGICRGAPPPPLWDSGVAQPVNDGFRKGSRLVGGCACGTSCWTKPITRDTWIGHALHGT